MNRRHQLLVLFSLLWLQTSAQQPTIPCDELFRRAQQLESAGQLSDAMLMLDAVSACDKTAHQFETRITIARVAINNEILRRDSLLKVEQRNLLIQQNVNRYRTSLLYSNLAQTAATGKGYSAASVYLARALQDSTSDKAKALCLELARDHYSYRGQLSAASNAPYTCIAMHPTRKLLVAGTTDSTLLIDDLSNPSGTITTIKFPATILKTAFSADGSTLAIGTSGSKIILLTTADWSTLATDSLFHESCGINDLAFTDDNRRVLVATSCHAHLLDFIAHTDTRLGSTGVQKIACYGQQLFAGTLGNLLFIWDQSSPAKPEKKRSLQPFLTRTNSLLYSTGALAAIPGTHRLMIGLTTGNFVEYDGDHDQLLSLPYSQSNGINDIRFISDKEFISASTDNSICFWDYSTGLPIEKFSNATLGFMAIATSPGHSLIATLEFNRSVRLESSNINAGKVRIWERQASPALSIPGKTIQNVEFSRNADSLVLVYGDPIGPPVFGSHPSIPQQTTIAINDLLLQAPPDLASLPHRPVDTARNTTIANRFPSGDDMGWNKTTFSPDGNYLLLTGWGGTLTLLETKHFTPVNGIFHPTPLGIPCNCRFSSDTRYLGCAMGTYLFVHDFRANRNDTIRNDQMIRYLSFIDNPALIVSIDSRQNTQLYRLGDNFEELASMDDMPFFTPAPNGKFLVCSEAGSLHLIRVNYTLTLQEAGRRTNLKLQFNNALTPVDP